MFCFFTLGGIQLIAFCLELSSVMLTLPHEHRSGFAKDKKRASVKKKTKNKEMKIYVLTFKKYQAWACNVKLHTNILFSVLIIHINYTFEVPLT